MSKNDFDTVYGWFTLRQSKSMTVAKSVHIFVDTSQFHAITPLKHR